MSIDNYIPHEFTFTPAISLFVTCDTEVENDRLFEQLSQDGQVLELSPIPLCGKFGVSRQLNFPKK
ncbi:VOC family protein [Sporosarcina sp. JAI121]|uniref:VOC family protein n=1 Tax=Sporosarcina sp. JAI121 TaxID=2723064 RepID=UPI003519EB78